MEDLCRTIDSEQLRRAWSILNEYHDFCRLACYRKKLEEQLRVANIPLTYVPWKSMVRALLCQSLFSDTELKEMNGNTEGCYTAADIASSEPTIDFLLENSEKDEGDFTETWFEIDELKQRFQRAMNIFPTNRRAQKEMLHKVLGYPIGYSEEEEEAEYENLNSKDDEPLDLTDVLSIDEQNQMRTGDIIELSGNRLHDAFYVYRLPEKGIWAQIQQMWSKHEITDFIFNHSETNPTEQEIILVPAMDEYGYGVPYLFATTPTEVLPDGALYKYVDINCPLTAKHTQNPTVALVQQHLNERLKNPTYQDKDMGEEMSIDPNLFPQKYVAFVHINDGPNDNVVWTRRIHYDQKQGAKNLNDNFEIFFSRRILEAEEQYQQKMNLSSN